MRSAGLIGYLLAATATAVLVLAVSSALRSRSAAPTFAPEAGATVYRPVRRPPVTEPPDGEVTVTVLPGALRDDAGRTASLEATFRLHLWLALRDVHPTGPVLDWSHAAPFGADRERVAATRCEPEKVALGRALGRDDPPLLGPRLRPRRQIRVVLDVGAEEDEITVEVRACAPGSRGTTQVFTAPTGREAPVLREILAWLTPQLGIDDVEPWFAAWSKPLAPDLGVLRTYGAALADSLGGDLPPDMLGAARLLPEAAWLAAALSPPGPERRALLEQAASQRPGFTAALEDLAWSWIGAGRADLARLALDRLRMTALRPSGLLLASRALDDGRPGDALALLDDLPPEWSGTTAARRLEARAQLGLGNAVAGRGAAAAWALADPSAAEAWVLQGDALVLLEEPVGARHAYEQALAHPSRLRPQVLERWAALLLSRSQTGAVLEVLDAEDEAALVARTPSLLELRAWTRWTAGDAGGASRDTARLVGLAPDTVRHRRNLCVFQLAAGLSEAPPEDCGAAVFPDLFGVVMEAAWLSRRPFRSPEEGGLLDRRLEEALALGPLDPAAAGAAVRVLAPRAEEEERDTLNARFRLSVGAVSP